MDYDKALETAVALLSRFPEDFSEPDGSAAATDEAGFTDMLLNGRDSHVEQYVRRFGKDPDMMRAAKAAAAQAIEQGRSLPEPARQYVARIVRLGTVPGRPGQHPRGRWQRDLHITMAVDKVVTEFGFNATRNASVETPSGCSIVKDALETIGFHISEGGVVKIWRAMAPLYAS